MTGQEQDKALTDPTVAYCTAKAKTVRAFARRITHVWYRFYRGLGCTAVDSLALAKDTIRDVTVDMSVNFDGPMQ